MPAQPGGARWGAERSLIRVVPSGLEHKCQGTGRGQGPGAPDQRLSLGRKAAGEAAR